jgi:hypothetical protein
MEIFIALNECTKIEEQITKIENDEQRLKIAYRIFNLDMIISKDLQYVKKVFNYNIEIKINFYVYRILKYLNQYGY